MLSQPASNATANVKLVPYREDPLQTLAQLVLDGHRGTPPDFSHTIVLLPYRAAVPRFRRILLDTAVERGLEALLPPYMGTLAAWSNSFVDDDRRRLSETTCEVMLLEALQEHPQLVHRCGTWPLVNSLSTLFDEMTRNQTALPDDLHAFTRVLTEGYGTPYPPPAPLSEEARLAHSLWTAWRRQLAAERAQDPAGAWAIGLDRSLERLAANAHVYLAGPVFLTRAELQWARTLLRRRQMTLVTHGQGSAQGYHPDTAVTDLLARVHAQPARATSSPAYGQFLDAVFDFEGADLLSRAQRLAEAHPASPARGRLVIHEATDFEQEARAIDLQVRRWRLRGLQRVAIVTNDRKLARRVRALLERANISLNDAAGWALSTTSAATALARWLDCLDHNFAYAPLFDVLRSPFVSLGFSRADLRRRVTWFEEGIVRRENIAGDLSRYRHVLDAGRHTLDQRYQPGAVTAVAELLKRLESAMRPFKGMVGRRSRPAVKYLAALRESLDTLGVTPHYRQDEAGAQLLAQLDEMRAALEHRTVTLSWSGFREWLRHNLECRFFRPAVRTTGVQLMGFAESRLQRFDAVVIAGALHENLPGQVDSSPFFNNGVRRQLGLPTASTQRYALLYDFRRLLEAAPQVVVTLRREQQGEVTVASPWVERLRVFHRIAYRQSLKDPTLSQLASSPLTHIVWRDGGCLPEPESSPSPTLPQALIPDKVAAAAHQRLLDCPYQYFATDALALTPIAAVREELEKLDYGERVHRILQAFHVGVKGLPGPFQDTLNTETRSKAESMLRAIAGAVFADDIRASVLARGWLLRWESSMKAYLDWQIQRVSRWHTRAAELYQRQVIANQDASVTLTARIDRLDEDNDQYAVIDYKTGHVPELAAVTTGEHIQLAFYTLVLSETVTQAFFLGLTGANASDKVGLQGHALQVLAEQVRQRLLTIQQSLHRGIGLPAWGDDQTCARCPMEGLCRKEMWAATGATTS